jgi:Mg-chelatase subunit ChlD
MQKNYTHITVILDRSGSMESIREDVIGGFNAFLREQQATEGRATLSLVQFDTQNAYEVLHNFKLVQEVAPLTPATYRPRAGTPLLDAMGRGIKELERQIIGMRSEDRPEQVLVVIITDGMENASQEFTHARVRQMILEKQELVGWQFVYLSADIGAVAEAVEQWGVRANRAMAFDKTAQGSQDAFASVSSNVRSMRRKERLDMEFSEEDRARHVSEQRRRTK